MSFHLIVSNLEPVPVYVPDIDFRPNFCTLHWKWWLPICMKYSWTRQKATDNQSIIETGFKYFSTLVIFKWLYRHVGFNRLRDEYLYHKLNQLSQYPFKKKFWLVWLIIKSPSLSIFEHCRNLKWSERFHFWHLHEKNNNSYF